MKRILFLILLFSVSSLNAQTSSVPKSLFGIELGGNYTLPDSEGQPGSFPVKQVVSTLKFLGSGLHIYFEPDKEYPNYPFRKYKSKPEDKYFQTNFRIYAYPDLPTSNEQLKAAAGQLIKFKVATVEWSGEDRSGKSEKEKTQGAYFWAKDFCKTLQLDQRVKPKITDSNDYSFYECEFKEGDRVLYVNSWVNGHFGLKYDQGHMKSLDSRVEKVQRKLNFNQDKPY